MAKVRGERNRAGGSTGLESLQLITTFVAVVIRGNLPMIDAGPDESEGQG